MRDVDATTRERLADALRDTPATPSSLATEFGLSRATVLTHLEHVSHSVSTEGEQFLVAPPTCRECGFDDYDDLLNVPSRCPHCKSEAVDEPTFVIE